MKFTFILSTLIFLFISCQNNQSKATKNQNIDYITRRNVILLNRFKCDSLETKYHSLYAYFSHSKSNFDELQMKQFSHYSISMVEFNISKIDTLVYSYHQKRSNVNEKIIRENFDTYYKYNVIYKSQLTEKIISTVFQFERESQNNTFLNELNREFAVAKHGDEVSRKAKIGIDAIAIIYNYLNDCQKGIKGENHEIVEKYRENISNNKMPSKKMHEKILELIDQKISSF